MSVLRDVLSWSFPIGHLFNIAIRVHLVLPIVFLGLVGRVAFGKDGLGKEFPANTWQDATMLLALMFVSILLHELGHCFAARFMDGEADEVLLWPLGGLAFCRSLPHTPIANFVVAAGGPLVNIVLCLMSGLAVYFAFDHLPPFSPWWYPYRLAAESVAVKVWTWNDILIPESNVVAIVLMRFFYVNWILTLFNLVLVGFPFDSGRMLQAALWPRMGHYQATKIAIYAGFVVMIILGLLSIVYAEPLMICLGIFIAIACVQEMMALEAAHEDSLFGYDFSQGYTSLEKDEPPPPRRKKQNFIQRWLAQRAAKKHQQEQEQREADDIRMDELLEKIQKFGKQSLTDEEQRFLKRVADRYKNKP
jgi:stage IV sporulation protein FB